MNCNLIKQISELYGTPIYIYDAEKIKTQYQSLKDALPEEFNIFYSMKANPLLGICQLLKNFGSNIEVASAGELSTAIAAGFSKEQIIFTSPGKTIEELEKAVEAEIYSINIESIQEAKLINYLGRLKQKKVDVSIRINPDFDLSGAGMKMSGVATQFGIDYSELPSAFNELMNLSNINILGIHVYNGTQILKAETLINMMEETIKMALQISKDYSIQLKFLDLGGGFGVPYFKNDIQLDIEELKDGISRIWDKYKAELSETKIAVESGRFLMAEAGVFATKVLYCKENKGQSYIVCDGGSNIHGNSAFLGRYIRNNFPMYILERDGDNITTNVVGPLCTPTDVIGQKVALPKASPGDIVVIEKSGAYGLTDSPVFFLSHPLPAEVIYYNKKFHLLRKRGNEEDFLRDQWKLL